jgi:hypothetical protein
MVRPFEQLGSYPREPISMRFVFVKRAPYGRQICSGRVSRFGIDPLEGRLT